MAVSPLSSPSSSLAAEIRADKSKELEAQLDKQILHIRNEIKKLRTQKQRLSSALLGSSRVQKQLFTRKQTKQAAQSEIDSTLDLTLTQLEAKIEREKEINDIKIHRLAFGVTSFPFSDNAPDRRDANGQNQTMLGLRFDLHPTRAELVPQQDGLTAEIKEEDGDVKPLNDEETNTYFIVLRKLQHNNKLYLKVHQHSIPTHIDVDALEQKYLPLPDALFHAQGTDDASPVDSFQDDSGIDLTQDIVLPDSTATDPPPTSTTNLLENTGQDLHTFTRVLHTHLRAWHYRMQSVFMVRQALEEQPEFGVQALRCTNDGRQVTVAWKSDELALLKVGFEGWIETVVAYGGNDVRGSDDGDVDVGRDVKDTENVRLYTVERKLAKTESGERVRISGLVDRLRIVQKYLDRHD